MPYLEAIDAYLRGEAAHGMLVLQDPRSATSFFIALIAGPETFRSRLGGVVFGPIDDSHLRNAVQVFIKGHSP